MNVAEGKFVGLDADTLDSAQFAPSALVATIGTPPSGSLIAGEIAAIRASDATTTTAFGTAIDDTKAAVAGHADAADAETIKARLGMPVAASLAADVAALAATVALLSTFEHGRAGGYCVTSADFSSRSWTDEDTCLQDGRWHRFFQLNPGTVNSSSTINATKFHAAAGGGADTKARIGYDWFQPHAAAGRWGQ